MNKAMLATALSAGVLLLSCGESQERAPDGAQGGSSSGSGGASASTGAAGSGAVAGPGGTSGSSGSSGSAGATAERFPLMLYAGPEVLTETPTIHDLHANLYFEWHQFNQPPEIMRAGLDKAAAAGVQVLMVLDRGMVADFTPEKAVKFDEWLAYVAGDPAVYGFYLADEPNLSPSISREEFLAVHEHCKKAAPDKPTVAIFAATFLTDTPKWPTLGIADIEGFGYYPYAGCDGQGYCAKWGEFKTIVQNFSSVHSKLENDNTKAYWVLIGSHHVKVCDETCGFGIPTKEDMTWLADYAMSVDPKYANGLVYFLYHQDGPDAFIGIQDEPAIAQSVTAINKQREFWPSLFPVRIPK